MTNDKLRGVLVGLDMERVGSVVASGNLVFSTTETDVSALEARIEAALTNDLGLRSRTIIRSQPDLRTLLDTDPFPGLVHGRGAYLTATFLKDPDARPALDGQPDPAVRVVGFDPAARAVLAVAGSGEPGAASGFMAWLERTCGRDITTRTWLTVQRIARKLEE